MLSLHDKVNTKKRTFSLKVLILYTLLSGIIGDQHQLQFLDYSCFHPYIKICKNDYFATKLTTPVEKSTENKNNLLMM